MYFLVCQHKKFIAIESILVHNLKLLALFPVFSIFHASIQVLSVSKIHECLQTISLKWIDSR